jgi:succinoglycan biosynthesis transport protein ExoP
MNEASGERIRRHSAREVHLRDYLMVLARYKWLIIAIIVVSLTSTIFYQRRQMPIYQARATIVIEPRRPQEVIFPQSVRAISLDLETQIEVIRTTPVLASVVKQLELTAAPEGTLEFSAAVKFLKGSIGIGFVKNTKMVTITARHPVPEKAQAIANAVAQAYIDQDRLSRLQTGRDAVKWLSAQLAELKTKLKTAEGMFQRFKEREGIISLNDKQSEELEEISTLNASYFSARSNRMEIEAIISKLESGNHVPGEESVDLGIPIALLDSPNLQRLGAELSGLQTELADKRRLFKDTYPGVKELRDRIRLTEQKILTELKRQRDFLKAQEDSFLTLQEAKHKEALKLGRKELEYLALEREVTTNREIYSALLAKVGELSLAGEADLNNIRIVEPAELPLFPGGNRMLTLVLGGVLGVLLGVGFAFFLTYLENTIRIPDDVEQYLGLPVLGIVPKVAEAKGSKAPIVVLNGYPKEAPAEAYRSLRTNLLFSGTDPPRKTIVISSAGPREGKSITTVNLGMALAQAGQNVLLVDADLRRPMLHRVFELDRQKGLSTVLAGGLALDEAITNTKTPKLSVLTSGSLPADPSQALGSKQMKDVINYAREHYDMVLFDSAPVLGMADTMVLAAETDGTVLVIKPGDATRKALKTATETLNRAGAQICGVVLNNVNVRRDRYYYKYYYYYSYYGDDEDRKSRKKKDGIGG